MRDEDLAKLPQVIERSAFGGLMEALGFKPGWQDQTKSIEMTYAGLEIVVYATDENGRKYFVPEEIELMDLGEREPTTIRGGGREAAVHEISIPFVGSWTKPAEAKEEQSFIGLRCGVPGPDGILCQRNRDHGEEHAARAGSILHKW